MSDSAKTMTYIVCAALMCCIAVFSTPGSAPPPDQFNDQGEPFYPEFNDPLSAAALEVIAYDEQSGTAAPFKVVVKDGLWSIPSHYDYPADGKERLAKTAAGVIDLKKDRVQSDRIEDHEALGVIDPLDETVTTLQGRGQRVRLLDDSGSVLADFIIGKEVEDRSGFRYVRLPEKKRTYAVKVDIELSTRFADWIETNLLDLTATQVKELGISDYSIDETTGRVDLRDTLVLTKDSASTWTMDGLADNEEVNQAAVRGIPTALSQIRITGVRPKPAGLSADLKTDDGLKIDIGTQLSLNSKGFFISQNGQLLSNEGEIDAGTTEGVSYTLRFGELIYGEGTVISAGGEDDSAGESDGGAENRYLFVTAAFDERLLGDAPQPPDGYVPTTQLDAEDDASQNAPAGTPDEAEQQEDSGDGGSTEETADEDADSAQEAADAARAEQRRVAAAYEAELATWNEKIETGRKAATELNDRFAAWYYVISASDFSKIRVGREQIVQEKTEE